MDNKPMCLELGETVFEMLRSSGATQVEQHAALDVARALIPSSGAPIVREEPELSPTEGA